MEQEDMILSTLRKHYQDREWFGDVGYDQYGRPVLYVKFECHETNWDIPDKWEGKQLLVHFLSSFTASANSFMHQEKKLPTPTQFMTIAHEVAKQGVDVGVGQMLDELEADRQLELSVRTLTDELDKLERICGSNILADIFFEEHDQNNAVTNLSARFPEVRQRMHKLYQTYGFDVIYEELEL